MLQSDHYYEYAEYDDEEYRPDFSQFGGHNNAEITNVDHGEPHEVDVEQVYARRALAKHQLLMTKLRGVVRVVSMRGVT